MSESKGPGRPKTKRAAVEVAEISDTVQTGIAKIQGLELKREAINSKIKAERDAIVAAGMDRATLSFVLACAKMDPADRQAADEANLTGRAAAGIPVTVQNKYGDLTETTADLVDLMEGEGEGSAEAAE
jgi:hypothetical protein